VSKKIGKNKSTNQKGRVQVFRKQRSTGAGLQEWKRAEEGEVTGDCQNNRNKMGASDYGKEE